MSNELRNTDQCCDPDQIISMTRAKAHDINNQIAGIMGNLDLMALDMADYTDDQKKFLRNAMTATHKAAGIMREIQTLIKSLTVFSAPRPPGS